MDVKRSAALTEFMKFHGEQEGEKILSEIGSISTKLADYSVDWIFGDLYQDLTLSTEEREISNISALMAIQAYPQIETHIRSALRAGISSNKIEAIMLNTIIIVGFPVVVNSLLILKKVLAE